MSLFFIFLTHHTERSRIIQTVNTRMMKSLPSELDADDAENEGAVFSLLKVRD